MLSLTILILILSIILFENQVCISVTKITKTVLKISNLACHPGYSIIQINNDDDEWVQKNNRSKGFCHLIQKLQTSCRINLRASLSQGIYQTWLNATFVLFPNTNEPRGDLNYFVIRWIGASPIYWILFTPCKILVYHLFKIITTKKSIYYVNVKLMKKPDPPRNENKYKWLCNSCRCLK